MKDTVASRQVLLDGAQMMIAANVAGTAGFLKERNIPLKDLADYAGHKFEDALGDLAGRGADEVMQHLLTLEFLPMGAEVVSKQMTADRAEVTLTPLPPPAVLEKFGATPAEFLEGFDITPKEYEAILGMFEPMAKAIGLKFRHGLKDGHEVISLEKVSK
jgi:hypothetical protein